MQFLFLAELSYPPQNHKPKMSVAKAQLPSQHVWVAGFGGFEDLVRLGLGLCASALFIQGLRGPRSRCLVV